LRKTHRPQVPNNVEDRENELVARGNESISDENAPSNILRRLRAVKYQEIVALAAFINDKTPFATKHGVKGAEFDNVLVVFGRGWSKYDFVQFLERAQFPDTVPVDEVEMFERNRNLFYVVCSRPKKRLAIMFTQHVSESAMRTLNNWFGADAIHALEVPS
jgi:DNA helicase-2/ATP-dependent DNA helicase PcrA